MKKQILMTACALMLIASPVVGQTGSGNGSGAGSGNGSGSGASTNASQTTTTSKDGKTTTTTTVKTDEQPRLNWVRTLTNVQIELTLSDQLGTQTPEKKTVSMIVSSGNWGKIRSAATVYPPAEPPYPVELNVDARPFVSAANESQVQLELTFVYAPVKTNGEVKEISSRNRPSGVNQSQTVVLTSGKPLIVSQAADPVTDRKVVIEVKATVLK